MRMGTYRPPGRLQGLKQRGSRAALTGSLDFAASKRQGGAAAQPETRRSGRHAEKRKKWVGLGGGGGPGKPGAPLQFQLPLACRRIPQLSLPPGTLLPSARHIPPSSRCPAASSCRYNEAALEAGGFSESWQREVLKKARRGGSDLECVRRAARGGGSQGVERSCRRRCMPRCTAFSPQRVCPICPSWCVPHLPAAPRSGARARMTAPAATSRESGMPTTLTTAAVAPLQVRVGGQTAGVHGGRQRQCSSITWCSLRSGCAVSCGSGRGAARLPSPALNHPPSALQSAPSAAARSAASHASRRRGARSGSATRRVRRPALCWPPCLCVLSSWLAGGAAQRLAQLAHTPVLPLPTQPTCRSRAMPKSKMSWSCGCVRPRHSGLRRARMHALASSPS